MTSQPLLDFCQAWMEVKMVTRKLLLQHVSQHKHCIKYKVMWRLKVIVHYVCSRCCDVSCVYVGGVRLGGTCPSFGTVQNFKHNWIQHKFQCAFTGYTGSLSWLTRALKCNNTINIFIYVYFSLYKPQCLPRKREATSTTARCSTLPAILVNVNTADL